MIFLQMASITGKIQEFKPDGKERFSTYIDRLNLYFDANSVAQDKKVAVFLTVIGAGNYALLSDHFAPDKPKDKSLDELIDVLKGHFEPEPILIAERFQFHKRDQKRGETIATFVAELRCLATHCSFGADFLDQALCDRFVCGLANEAIQKKLLLEADLDLAKAVKIALSLKGADKSSHAMHGALVPALITSTEAEAHRDKDAVHTMRKDTKKPCYRCGRSGHSSVKCRFKEATCHSCGKVGHIAPACRGKSTVKRKEETATRPAKGPTETKKKDTRWIDTDSNNSGSDATADFSILSLEHQSQPPISVLLQINGKDLRMELDTGAAMSLISEVTKKEILPDIVIRPSDIILRTYTAEAVEVVGQCDVMATYEHQSIELSLLVVSGSGPSLIGRDWMAKIQFNWFDIKRTRCQKEELDSLINSYPSVFTDGLGTMSRFTASLDIKPGITPKFFRPRSVPFAIRDAVDQELQRLEAENIIFKVNHSQWAAPIVAVPKKDGKLRICGDYKVTINPVMNIDQHPLPKPDDLFATLAGGKIFSKIDLTHAYQQMPLDEDSQKLVTINTHRGLYQYHRLPFGVASAPALFQKAMDTILQGIPHVICYIDDILVSGGSYTQHLQEVFRRLANEGITVKRSKCAFLTTKVEFLGHVIDQDGLHTSDTKVQAILNAPPTTECTAIKIIFRPSKLLWQVC